MFIDAFTCCVGPVYAGYLKRSLPVWMDTLDSLTVVTSDRCEDTVEACRPYTRLRLVKTPVFYEHGAHFNKGAALSIAYAKMQPVEGALHFDSDIMPDSTWRRRAERLFVEGAIHGARRLDERGRLIEDKGPWPYGYFQLWHANDPAVQFWPLFEPWHPHAGSYDLEFLENWPSHKWRDLGFKVTHFGEVRQNWFGVGLEEREQQKAYERMQKVHHVGLAKTRQLARRKENRLKVPDFALKFSVSQDRHRPHRVRELIRACMTDDPFLVEARVGESRGDYERLGKDVTPEQLRLRVEDAYKKRHG
jgi:hypothetical protein